MKTKIIIWIIICLANITGYSQKGRGCFLSEFNANATNLDKSNAYLIAYLNTMIYPGEGFRFLYGKPYPKQESKTIEDLQKSNAKFRNEYESKLRYLFEKSQLQLPGKPLVDNAAGIAFDFQSECNPSGYDPEAMIVSTDNFIQVIFRGTDRVNCATSAIGYEVLEWTKTNFDFGTIKPPKFSGRVHQGFWKSLNENNFAYKLAKKLVDVYGAKNKKVWISGHSLGGAHAQLFALYLKLEHDVDVQGLYLYASPHPGDQDFVDQINSAIGKNKIQRFEFVDDPIPVLPPQAPPFNTRRAGVRNWFKDINTFKPNVEQVMAIDDSKAMCAFAPKAIVANLLHLDVFNCPGSVCYHHPTWYLKACRNLLPASQYEKLPPDIPTPDLTDAGCTPMSVCLGGNNDVVSCTISIANDQINDGINAIGEAIEEIIWNASNYWNNVTGQAVEEGKYRLACYKFHTKEKKYLTRRTFIKVDLTSTPGYPKYIFDKDQMFLDKKRYDGKQIFKIKKDGANYIITNADDANSVVSIQYDEINKEGADVNMDEKAAIDVVGNQHWWFFKIKSPKGKTTYLIKNQSLPGKVIDAANDCNDGNKSCNVNVFKAISNEPSQLWVLEKVD